MRNRAAQEADRGDVRVPETRVAEPEYGGFGAVVRFRGLGSRR
jgi:hypothetical protein